ncbi:glycerate kinase [Nocardia vinacea]|uniref:glycerate kinase n=1 Tax=Nocardia vinacea TaxID=96468 RepID=UPI00031ED20D|nr:glycerate kinase [Nocardia vinacea]
MSRVLIASDKFKGSLTAAQVGAAVRGGIHRVRPGADVSVVPIADGGDGTVAAALAAGFEAVLVTASGPTGEAVCTAYARRDDIAVVELADVSGLVRLPGGAFAPMTATSRGTGEVIAAAIDAGCRRVVLGIGGSAGTDGGAGLLAALGARLLDVDGAEIDDGGAALARLHTIDLASVRERLAGVELTVACDVDNPLTGPRGAAAVYGPQKGADGNQVEVLDAALTHWADRVAVATGTDLRDRAGAGAAGGVGFAAVAVLGARLRPGIELVLELVGFAERVADADLVVTGEGMLDEQTLYGKAPAGVATAAGFAGVPVIAVCGRNTLPAKRLLEAGFSAAYALADIEPDIARCFAEGELLLERLGVQIAAEHLPDPTAERPSAGHGSSEAAVDEVSAGPAAGVAGAVRPSAAHGSSEAVVDQVSAGPAAGVAGAVRPSAGHRSSQAAVDQVAAGPAAGAAGAERPSAVHMSSAAATDQVSAGHAAGMASPERSVADLADDIISATYRNSGGARTFDGRFR